MASWETIKLIQQAGAGLATIPAGIELRKKRKYETAVRISDSSWKNAEKLADELKASGFQVAPEIVSTPSQEYPADPTTNLYSVKQFRDVPGFGPVYGQAVPEGPGPLAILAEQQRLIKEKKIPKPLKYPIAPLAALGKTSRIIHETKGGRPSGPEIEKQRTFTRNTIDKISKEYKKQPIITSLTTALTQSLRSENDDEISDLRSIAVSLTKIDPVSKKMVSSDAGKAYIRLRDTVEIGDRRIRGDTGISAASLMKNAYEEYLKGLFPGLAVLINEETGSIIPARSQRGIERSQEAGSAHRTASIPGCADRFGLQRSAQRSKLRPQQVQRESDDGRQETEHEEGDCDASSRTWRNSSARREKSIQCPPPLAFA